MAGKGIAHEAFLATVSASLCWFAAWHSGGQRHGAGRSRRLRYARRHAHCERPARVAVSVCDARHGHVHFEAQCFSDIRGRARYHAISNVRGTHTHVACDRDADACAPNSDNGPDNCPHGYPLTCPYDRSGRESTAAGRLLRLVLGAQLGRLQHQRRRPTLAAV